MSNTTLDLTAVPQIQKKRRILLCVTGLSPQIVTETLFALSVNQTPRWIPDEIHLITTRRGADNARLMLLSDNPGWFHRLCHDLKLPPIAFDATNIAVLRDAQGNQLDDIRDDDDNQRAADGISDLVRRLTEDENSEIHASIAGGRKTMGFFMGYAMSLWGRPQDRLSHVLISPLFESRPEFFYPTPTPHVIPAHVQGQDPLDASTAKVWLGDIPFVRLRNLLPASIKAQDSSFAQAVAAANRALDQVDLEIDIARSCVRINQQTIALPPMQMGLLGLLAWRCKQQLPPLRAPLKEVDDPEWRIMARRELNQAFGEMNIPDSLDKRLGQSKPMGGTVSEQLSKMEKILSNSGALPLSGLIGRANIGIKSRQQGYSLKLRPERVNILKPAGRIGKLAK
ncbi:CRISPR-associated ring nuclease Csm6 [Limnohabitans sp. Rim8]|uniref:CRISPR-associated ring nuclease Csm6 n=1 Tax=Limnohabitans sp. Rim8 TaxID=1100718 RepID=UPI00262F9824|nr:CRISPR-associated ring nuclease Csm6 [Limnohabitans sp. Rim8]